MRNDFVVYVALSSATPRKRRSASRNGNDERSGRTSNLPCVPILYGISQNTLRLVALLEPVSAAEHEGIVRLDLDSVVGFVPRMQGIPMFCL